MNELKFTGKITKIYPTQEGSKNGKDWKRIDFVVEEEKPEYPQTAAFSLFGVEKVDKFLKYNKEGDTVDVSFNLKADEYNGKHYQKLDAWHVYGGNKDAANSSTGTNSAVPVDKMDDQTLPF